MPLWSQILVELVVLCGVFWLLCFLGIGGDKKNIKSFSSYPDEVQKIVSEREDLKPLIKVAPLWITFLSNIIMFTIILFIFAVWIRQDSFIKNFGIVSILGQGLNLFDFLIMDICWWRNSKKIRFTGTEDQPQLYKPIKKHFYAFLRGIVCFLIVALIVGGIITLF